MARGYGEDGVNGARMGAQLRKQNVNDALLAALGLLATNESFAAGYRLMQYKDNARDNLVITGAISRRLDGWRYYRLNEEKHEEIEKRLQSISRRAKKLEIAPIDWQWSEEKDYVLDPKSHIQHTFSFLRLQGEEPKLNGYEFLATLQHEEAGTMVRRLPNAKEDLDLRAWHNTEPICEHCNLRRHRKDTYLVRHPKTGEIKQIGRSCLKDYLGGHDPDSILRRADWQKELEDSLTKDEYAGLGSGVKVFPTDDFLALTAAHIREDGWVSKQNAYQYDRQATAEAALTSTDRGEKIDDNMYRIPYGFNEYRILEITDQDRKKAEAALVWARTEIPVDTEQDYLHNLRVAASRDVITHREAGLLASVIVAYDKANEKKEKARIREAKTNEHFGAPGDKVQGMRVTLKKVYAYEGHYGTKYFHTFEDQDGRTFKWATNKSIWSEGSEFDLSGTIKDHSEYNGTKETNMLRCKLAEV